MNTNIIKQKQYILLLSRLKCKKKCSNKKRFAARHLLTFESQKLNYFGKKSGTGVLTLQCNSYVLFQDF